MTVAIALFTMVNMSAFETGACFNPTVGITFTTMEYARDGYLYYELKDYLLAYALAPNLGGILAALWFVIPASRV